MATRRVIAANVQRLSLQATVMNAGNIATGGPVTDAFTLAEASVGAKADPEAKEDATYTHKPLTAGVYGNFEEGVFILKKVTTTISRVANTLLQSGASDFNKIRSIHFSESIRTLLQVTAGWNFVTGQFLTDPGVQLDVWHTPGPGTIPDDAARPTRAVPGEFTFMEGGKLPVDHEYEEKHG